MVKKPAKPSRTTLGRINIVLIALILGINVYIAARPVMPYFGLWWRKWHSRNVGGLPYETNLGNNPHRKPIPADDRLVIPKIAVNEHIYQGTDPYTINKGVWALPHTSTPPEGSNTVMAGHRFNYSAPASFFSLDKLAAGDTVVVYWDKKEYDYKVESSRVVPPDAIEIEKPTKKTLLTLYTCTPLWTAKNRLVVTAMPLRKTDE